MDGIRQYQQVRSLYQESKTYASRGKEEKSTGSAGESRENREVSATYEKTDIMSTLSDDARKLLEDLKEKYGNVDFFVANYSTEEEAGQYLRQGKKEYSVLLEPELLEQMAADSAVRDKYEGLIDSSIQKLGDMREQLGDKKDLVKRLGVSVSSDGEVSFFADLEKLTESQKERIEKSREAKKEQKARLYGDSVEELLEKIRSYEFPEVKTKEQSGNSFDMKL